MKVKLVKVPFSSTLWQLSNGGFMLQLKPDEGVKVSDKTDSGIKGVKCVELYKTVFCIFFQKKKKLGFQALCWFLNAEYKGDLQVGAVHVYCSIEADVIRSVR